MLTWIFSTYVPNLPLLVYLLLLGVALLTPVIAAWLLGSSGSKSAGSRLSARQRQTTWIALAIVGLATAHLALPVVGKGALEPASPASPNLLLELIIGPAGYDAGTLLARAGIALAAGLLAALGAGLLVMDGGPLREQANRWRDPSRRRGELGSATFCLPGDFARLQRPKPEGLALQGAFWGKRSRHEPADRFYRLDSGPLRSQNGGVCLSVEDQARGLVFIGPAGAGKSQAGILPAAADTMLLDHSLILADPQGELAPHILDYAAVTGHQVILHDPTNPMLPRCNLAEGIHQVAEAQAITRVLLGSGGRADDPFWQQSAQNLLAACLLRYDTLGDILLALSDLQALANKLGETQDGAAYLAASFIASARSDGKVASSIAATVQASPLSAWADETVRQATAATDFSAGMLVEEPTVLLLRCPGRYMKVYGPYLGAVLQRLMLDLDTLGGQTPGGALARPVHVILDEFPMLGRLGAVVEAVNLFRKRRISFTLAAQTISQLELVYGQAAAEALVAGLATQVVFGSCDAATAAYVSRMLGRSTERVPTQRAGEPPLLRQRDLLSLEEVITPAVGNCTLIHRYATTTYAAQVVMLAQLTPMYERADWQESIRQARQQGREAWLLAAPPSAPRASRPAAPKPPQPEPQAIATPKFHEVER